MKFIIAFLKGHYFPILKTKHTESLPHLENIELDDYSTADEKAKSLNQ